MSFNGVSPLWDFSLPPALPEISDDQFLTLLNRQFESTKADNFQSTFNSNPTADPQTLTRFPQQTLNLSPLVSEESSPSPPGSSTDPTGSRSRKVSQSARAHRATRSTDRADDHLKRKASQDDDDDDDDEDGHRDKSFHGDDDAPTKKSSRRKSTGGNQKSEDRLQKRKEQNRAAQRAFRERKEKHVRDLEEKVAMLEAKSDIQASENENLRDLLGRLQSENLSLKQSSFTFAVQPGSDAARASKSPASVGASPNNNLASNMEGYDTSMAYFSPTFFNQATALPAASSPQPADLSAYGVGPPYSLPTQSPYTTIAANPLYMSFAETPSFSSYLSPSESGSSSGRAGSSKGASAATSNTTPEGMMSPKSMQELFGTQFEGLVPFNGNFNIFSPENPVGHTAGSMSPVAHTSDPSGEHKDCPKSKEELASRIAVVAPTTLGPPPSSAMAVDFLTPQDREDALASACEPGNDLPCHVFPAIPESSKNVTLNDAWERVSKHPQFSECDMDELCALLTAQAKCDGSKPVLEPSSVTSVMDKIPHLASTSRK
ncbi:hypothetical protein EXIGLDRAFT_829672 [Exidia glandulosa HHB12029]|uniref:BZIP domain-containing protein n=1 Tax=Exidia glandulosa HHB12029 TaxID=1314781 RepID=A0A165PFW8_EXIGL|nr:hypothetical protein EXIGLDRAFT_829672 [Exidia glandulosa HHB12029]